MLLAIVVASFAVVASFLFLNTQLARACGGSVRIWAALLFDLLVGVSTFIIVRLSME